MILEKDTLDFLKTLDRNNNREWFQKHKERYLLAQQNTIQWLDALIAEINKHDQLQTQNGKEGSIASTTMFAFRKTKHRTILGLPET